MISFKNEEQIAFERLEELYLNGEMYNETIDAIYNYLKSIKCGYTFDVGLFVDEIENYLGIRNHKDIMEYIYKKYLNKHSK